MTTSRSSSPARLLARAAIGAAALALVATPLATAASAPPKTFFFSGSSTILWDPAVFAPLGVQVLPGEGAVGTNEGLRVKVTEGEGTTRYPLSGQIRSVKGMTFTQGTTRLSLNWFNVGLGKTRPLSALVGSNADWGPRMTLFATKISKASVIVKPGRFQLKNVPVVLTPVGATVLNQHFGAGAAPFVAAQRVGTLQVRTRSYQK